MGALAGASILPLAANGKPADTEQFNYSPADLQEIINLFDFEKAAEGSSHGRFASDLLSPALATLRALDARELAPENAAVERVLEQLRSAAHSVSDELSLKFFSHATSRSMLSLVA